MSAGRLTGSETILRLACLALSIGLHAGLVAAVWQGFEVFRGEDRAILVTLGERHAPVGLKPGPVAERPRQKRRTSVPSQNAVPVAVPAKPPVEVTALPARSATAVVETMAVAMPVSLLGDSAPPVDGGPGGSASPGAGDSGNRHDAAMEGDGAGSGEQGNLPPLVGAIPRYAFNPRPDYPAIARQNRWQGTVRVLARVTAGGLVERVSLEQSSGYAMLDRSALDSVRRWRFVPAKRDGIPVLCDVSIPVAFRLEE